MTEGLFGDNPLDCRECRESAHSPILAQHNPHLEVSIAWAPLLSTETRDADDLLAGPECLA